MSFASDLNTLITRYRLKVTEVAAAINVNQGYVSKVRHEKASLSFEQFEKPGTMLEHAGAEKEEMELFCDSFISEKSGIPLEVLQQHKSTNELTTLERLH